MWEFFSKAIPHWTYIVFLSAVTIVCMWFFIRMQSAEIDSYKLQLKTIASTYTSVYNAEKKKSDDQLAALKAQGQLQVQQDNQKIAQIQTDTNNQINAIENAPKSSCLDQMVPDVIIEQFLTPVVPTQHLASLKNIDYPRVSFTHKSQSLDNLFINMPQSIMYVSSAQGEHQ